MGWDPQRPLADQLEAAWADGSPTPVDRASAIVELARRVDQLMKGLRKVRSGLRELTAEEHEALSNRSASAASNEAPKPRRRRKTTGVKPPPTAVPSHGTPRGKRETP